MQRLFQLYLNSLRRGHFIHNNQLVVQLAQDLIGELSAQAVLALPETALEPAYVLDTRKRVVVSILLQKIASRCILLKLRLLLFRNSLLSDALLLQKQFVLLALLLCYLLN